MENDIIIYIFVAAAFLFYLAVGEWIVNYYYNFCEPPMPKKQPVGNVAAIKQAAARFERVKRGLK